MKSININTLNKYKIYFDCNINQDVIKIIDKFKHSKIIIIYDSKLTQRAHQLHESIVGKIPVELIEFKVSEGAKSLDNATLLMNDILQFNIDKQSALVALGGGVIGDMVGFCASVLLRGIPYYQIPTTLLACVDSSIGGKCGVNTNYGKNIIGSIYNPKAVFIDYSTLCTLPYNDYASGYGECVKYALLFDDKYFKMLCKNHHLILNRDMDYIKKVIMKSCLFKKNIVQRDEKEEKNIRHLLNLGHTFAHALEKYNNYQENLTHGQAVAIGCIWAYKFAYQIKLIKSDESNIIKQHFINVNLNVDIKKIIPNINYQLLIKHMLKDKKNTHNSVNLILPKKIGKCILFKNINIQLLSNFLQGELNQ